MAPSTQTDPESTDEKCGEIHFQIREALEKTLRKLPTESNNVFSYLPRLAEFEKELEVQENNLF
jgi:hypothetical protein